MTYPGHFNERDQNLIIDVANMVSLAYLDDTELVKRWMRMNTGAGTMPVPHYDVLNRLTMPEVIQDANLGLTAFAAEYLPIVTPRPVLAVVIRGSDDLTDWFLNFQTKMVKFGANSKNQDMGDVHVHSGFRLQYLSVLGKFSARIDTFLERGGVVMFAGHSLGAAVSSLLALNYGSYSPGQVWNLTFGSPRVGNKQFAARCAQAADLLWRVKNCRDPICKVLPEIVGYRHVGEEIHLGDGDPFPNIPIIFDVADHAHWNYVRNLVKNGSAPATTPVNTLVMIKEHVDKAGDVIEQMKMAAPGA